MLSLKARRSGLFGEVLLGPERRGTLRFAELVCLGVSVEVASAVNARDRPDGDTGAVGEELLDLGALIEKRAGLDGDRERDRRIC